VAPLRLGGLRGKKSTPSVWLGGIGELLEVECRSRSGNGSRSGKQEQERQAGARAAGCADNSGERRCGNGMIFLMVVRMPGKGVV
jgi:hypothetical protein